MAACGLVPAVEGLFSAAACGLEPVADQLSLVAWADKASWSVVCELALAVEAQSLAT